MKHVLWLAVTLLLFGCGGGGDDDPDQAQGAENPRRRIDPPACRPNPKLCE